MFHSFRTASFGLTGSQNRFIGAMGESYYNVSGQIESRETTEVVDGNLNTTASFTHNAVSTAASCHSHCINHEQESIHKGD